MGNRRHSATLMVLTALCVVLSACAAAGSGGNVTPESSGSAGTPAASAPASGQPSAGGATGSPGPPRPTGSLRLSDEVTLTGTVEEGVESGCMLLRTQQGLYLLIGGDRQMIARGGKLVVRGKAQPDLMTTCQQGTPFQVTEVRRG
jgi:hypothetical protein